MSSIKIVGKQCTGCGLCEQVCHASAISMIEDKKGFLYPEVNEDICIDCGLCVKACPSSNEYVKDGYQPEVLLAYNKDQDVLKRSTSGGVFYNLASEIIRGGDGIAYGAVYTDNFYVQHDGAESIREIGRFHGSKYVQSDIRNCYSSIETNIENHKHVLFSGTACEIAAIKEFCRLNHLDEELLTTVEIICWAVPSPGVFRNHVDLLQENENSKLTEYSFRDKKNGWGGPYIRSASFADGHSVRNNLLLQSDGELYSKKYNMRESCFTCRYKTESRIADITIGDCWGIADISQDMENKNGVSQVWLNSEKGKALWKKVEDAFEVKKITYEAVLSHNPALIEPVKKPVHYDEFWKYYEKEGYKSILRRYTHYGLAYRMLAKTKKSIMRVLKLSKGS